LKNQQNYFGGYFIGVPGIYIYVCVCDVMYRCT